MTGIKTMRIVRVRIIKRQPERVNNLSCIKILGWNMSEHPDFDDRKPDDEPVERPDEGQPLNPFSPDDKRDPII
ncbi:hypothetical protein ACVNWL_004798 [Escherichia coli]